MGEIDFETEARAWVNWYRSHSVPPLPEHLAIEYERIDARARAEGEADGYRRGDTWVPESTGLRRLPRSTWRKRLRSTRCHAGSR